MCGVNAGGIPSRGTPARSAPTLVFDIETVPDTELGRRLYGLKDLSDEQVAQIMFTKRRQETGSEFLSHEQHRVVAISVVMRSRDSLKVWSLGEEGSSEKDLIERFFDGLGQVHARIGVLERRGLRSAGAALPQPPAQHHRGTLLGDRRRRFELPLQQLLEPLPLAAHGSDGYLVRLSGPRPREPAGCRVPARASRQARHARLSGLGGVSCRAASSASATIARPTCSTPI